MYQLLAATFAISVFASTGVKASEALAKKYACTACHTVEKKLVGPAFKDVAAKYADGSVKVDALAARIKSGSSGKWGAIPMPGQPQIPPDDLSALAGWILELK